MVLTRISDIEIRICVYVYLALMMIITFAVLRMYNAMVGNTRFLMLLKNELQRFINQLKSFENQLTQGIDSFPKKVGTAFNTLERAINRLTDKLKDK